LCEKRLTIFNFNFLGIVIFFFAILPAIANGINSTDDTCENNIIWYKKRYELIVTINVVSFVIFLIIMFLKNVPNRPFPNEI